MINHMLDVMILYHETHNHDKAPYDHSSFQLLLKPMTCSKIKAKPTQNITKKAACMGKWLAKSGAERLGEQ